MLPTFLRSSYKQYKSDSDFVATWLARTAQRCGYPKDLLLSQTEESQKTPKLKGRARKLARDAAKQSGTSSQPNTLAKDSAHKPSRYTIAIRDFIALAEWIVRATKPAIEVPTSFVSVLDRAITVRKRHHECDQKQDANKKHQFFISILEQVREVLKPRMSAELLSDIPTTITGDTNESKQSLPNLFSGLTVEQPVDPSSTSAASQPASASSTASEEAEEYTVPQEQDIEEVHFAVHCLFNDLDNIRRYLVKVWEGYKTGAFDLIAASITTNTAIEFSRSLQDDFLETFPQHADFERHINVLYVQQCLAYGETPTHRERFDDEMNFSIYSKVEPLMFPTFMILSSFSDVIQPGQLPMYKPGHFGIYDASSDRNSKSARDKFREDKILLLETLPDFCVLAQHRGIVPAEDELTRGVREMIKTKKTPIWLVFAAQLFLDIHHVLRDQTVAGFNALTKSAQYVATGINSVLEFHKDLRVDTWPRSNDQVLLQILDIITTWVQKDRVLETRATLSKRTQQVQLPVPESFLLLKRHPLYCGLLSYSIKMLALDGAITFANAWGSVLYCAHLYNAVRQEMLLTDVWQDMNCALFMHKTEAMFVGYSASKFAKNKRKGQPAASKAGPRALNDLAPVSSKFKARLCHGEERSGLPPTDIEAILAEHADNFDGDDSEGESSEWFRPSIKDSISKSSDPTIASDQLETSKRGKTSKRSSRSAAARARPIEILNALLNAIQSEAFELTFDHFRLHTFCWRLLRNVQKNLDSDLREIYGAGYLEKENQLPWVVGYIFMAASQTSKLAGILLPKKTDVLTNKLLAKAAESIRTMIHTGAGAIEIGMLKRQFGFEVDMDDLLGETTVLDEGRQ